MDKRKRSSLLFVMIGRNKYAPSFMNLHQVWKVQYIIVQPQDGILSYHLEYALIEIFHDLEDCPQCVIEWSE